MSTKLKPIKLDLSPNPLLITQFYGGTKLKTCVQLTQYLDNAGKHQYIQLNKRDARKLAKYLIIWAK